MQLAWSDAVVEETQTNHIDSHEQFDRLKIFVYETMPAKAQKI